MSKKSQILSVVIPVHNEEANLPLIVRGLLDAQKKLIGLKLEVLFVDDGSTDDSIKVLKKLVTKHTNISVIELSRNFGKEVAVTAGLRKTKGDAVIIMDADMQHPPELLPEFVKKWREGSDVIVGVRKTTHRQNPIRRLNSWAFYKLINGIAEQGVMPQSTDFRLLSRQVVEEFNRFSERNRITRGLIDWLGFKHDYIYFVAPPRAEGKPSYSFTKLIRLAINSMVSLSLFPLRLAGYLGVFITLSAGLVGLFILIEKYVMHDPFNYRITGAATLVDMNIFLMGIVLMCLGLVALYIANIHDEVLNRPLYVVRNEYRTTKNGHK